MVNTNGDFTGHSTYFTNRTKIPRGVGRLKVGQVLDERQYLKLGVGEDAARYLSNDIIDTNVIASNFNIRNISTTNSQITIMKEMFGEQEIANSVDIKYPFIGQNDLREVLKFRDNEWHHLHDFRKALDEGLGSGEDVASLFKDEEAKIEKILRARYRTLNRELIDEGGKVAFHATAAAATGGISAIMSAIAAAIGGKHLVDSFIPSLRKRFEEPEEPRESKFYYAWRAKRDFIGKSNNIAA